MQIRNSKSAIVGIGSFMAASLGVSLSASTDEDATEMFVANSLDELNPFTADDEGSCGEGKCGEGDEDSDDEDGDDEGECGEGECGEGECGEEGEDEEEEEESTEE